MAIENLYAVTKKLSYTDFRRFEGFSDEILAEIVREGEVDLQARLATANAVDQRAYSILGFEVAILVAAVGGIMASLGVKPYDGILISIATLFSFGVIISVIFAYLSVVPKLFAYPGNSPHSWFIEDWHEDPGCERNANMKNARIEQCYCLYSAIYDNSKVMEENAACLKRSLAAIISSGVLAFVLGFIVMLYRVFLS